MSTLEAPLVADLWDLIHEETPSAEKGKILFGGSVGDTTHQLEYHSYHESFNDQRHDGGYSVHLSGDRNPPRRLRNYASAIDITMHDPALMKKYTDRLIRATRTGSPLQLIGLREFAGTIDGQNVYAMDTHDKKNPTRTYGWDSSHLWHIHLSLNRRMLDDKRLLHIAEIWADKPFGSVVNRHPHPVKKPAPSPLYTVKSGDTLSVIGLKHGLTWQQLQRINHLKNPNNIYVGEKLRVVA